MPKDSIILRFALISLAIIVLILGGSGIYSYNSSSTKLKQYQKNQLDVLVSQTKLITSPLLWDFEIERLQNTLLSLAKTDNVAAIFIIDSSDTVIGVRKTQNGGTQLFDDYQSYDEFGYREQITFDDDGQQEAVGEILLVIDHSVVENQLQAQLNSLIFETLFLSITLIGVLAFMLRTIVGNPLNSINHAIQNISQGDGDLTQKLDTNHSGEVATLSISVNAFIENLRQIVSNVVHKSNDMSQPVERVNTLSKRTQEGAELQRTKITSVTEAIEHLTQAADEVARGTSEAANNAVEITDFAKSADAQLQTMTQTIQTLADDISKGAEVINDLQGDVTNIVSVLDVISGIAEQTNLLALNAAIEAARAGEQGRGFAVVADEVRSLASKTRDSTQEIQVMIENLENASQRAVDIMRVGKDSGDQTVEKITETQSLVSQISEAILVISDKTVQIASAAEEQTAMSSEVQKNIAEVVDAVTDVSNDASETFNASDALTQLINEQEQLLAKFRT